jgi:hypothetical protein
VAIEAAALYSVAAMVAETRILAGRTSAKMELIGMPRAVESERYAAKACTQSRFSLLSRNETTRRVVLY